MGLFDKVFGSNTQESAQDASWNSLEDMKELDVIEKQSHERPVAIFKHSTRCGVSRMAWSQFQKEHNISNDTMELYNLDILANRDISNEIAKRFGVVHQSPQLIVIKNGKSVYHASHGSIDASQLEQFI